MKKKKRRKAGMLDLSATKNDGGGIDETAAIDGGGDSDGGGRSSGGGGSSDDADCVGFHDNDDDDDGTDGDNASPLLPVGYALPPWLRPTGQKNKRASSAAFRPKLGGVKLPMQVTKKMKLSAGDPPAGEVEGTETKLPTQVDATESIVEISSGEAQVPCGGVSLDTPPKLPKKSGQQRPRGKRGGAKNKKK